MGITGTLLASLHYIALAIGFAGIFWRGVILKDLVAQSSTKRLMLADNLWGIAAFLWIVTGLGRAFGDFEKGAEYYLHSHLFWLKMALFIALLLLELTPMITFIKWRTSKKTVVSVVDLPRLAKFKTINDIETILVFLIPFVASALARGY